MTQQTTEFELKPESYVCYEGRRCWHYGRHPGDSQSLISDNGKPRAVFAEELTEWKTDPKPSFAERREDCAKQVIALLHAGSRTRAEDYVNAAESVRALEPDTPAAAVAGSAKATAWMVKHPVASPDLFLTEDQALVNKNYYGGDVIPLYLAPPSPPQPNPVEREAGCIGYMSAIALGALADLFKTGSNATWVGVMTKQAMGEVTVPIYTIPPTVSAPFDEATERKLFEAWWHEFDPAALLGELQNCARSAWLASARIDRRNK